MPPSGCPIHRTRLSGCALATLAGLFVAATTVDAQAHPLDDLMPGHWYEVPDSRVETEFPDPPPIGNSGPGSVIGAWGGGAFDSIGERLLIWGGGHADYAGNEIYAFDVETMLWTRAWGPTPGIESIPGQCSPTYDDGNPSSRHTYDGMEFSPEAGLLWASGGFRFCGNASPDTRTWLFDPNQPGAAWMPGTNSLDANGTPTSAYDPVTGLIYYQGAYDFQAYDPVADTYTLVANVDAGWWLTANSTIDPVHRLMLSVGGGGLRVWDLNTLELTREQPTAGGEILIGAGPAGLQWDPELERPVVWVGGTSVYSLDVDTWEWFEHAPADDNAVMPTAPNGNGTYGRFRYMPSRNAYVVVNATNDNVFFYKATAGVGMPVPDPDPTGDSGGETTTSVDDTGGQASGDEAGDSTRGDGSPTTASTAAESSGGTPLDGDTTDGGCGCRTTPSMPSHVLPWLLAVVLPLRRRSGGTTTTRG